MAVEYYEGLFDQYEYVEMFSGGYINRGDLIAINGQTIHEMMKEEYLEKGGKDDEFDQWYQEHLVEETKKHVMEAFRKNIYVDMFEVDERGYVKKRAQRINHHNVQFEDEQKVQRTHEIRNEQNIHEGHARVRETNQNAHQAMLGIMNDKRSRLFEHEGNKFWEMYPEEGAALIEELQSADRFLLTGSEQFKHMQDSLLDLAAMMVDLDNPPTRQQVRELQTASSELAQKVDAYLTYKDVNNTEKRRSSRERRRIAAAQAVKDWSNTLQRSVKTLDKGYEFFAEEPQQENTNSISEKMNKVEEEKDIFDLGEDDVSAIGAVPDDFDENDMDFFDLGEKNQSSIGKRMNEVGDVPDVDKRDYKIVLPGQREQIYSQVDDYVESHYGVAADNIYKKDWVVFQPDPQKQRSMGVMEHLGSQIKRDKNFLTSYLNNEPITDQAAWNKKCGDMVARMVTVELIAGERRKNGYEKKQDSYSGNKDSMEVLYASNADGFLDEVKKMPEFQNLMDNMSQDKMWEFLNQNQAKSMAADYTKAAKEKLKAQKAAQEESAQKQALKEKSIEQKSIEEQQLAIDLQPGGENAQRGTENDSTKKKAPSEKTI